MRSLYMVLILVCACATACGTVRPPFGCFPIERPEIGEVMVLRVEEKVYAIEQVRAGRTVVTDCTLRPDGQVMATKRVWTHFLLRYARGPAPPTAGECPNGTLFVDTLQNYGMFARDAEGRKVFSRDEMTGSLLAARHTFERGMFRPVE